MMRVEAAYRAAEVAEDDRPRSSAGPARRPRYEVAWGCLKYGLLRIRVLVTPVQYNLSR
jgi:hypothetical protein